MFVKQHLDTILRHSSMVTDKVIAHDYAGNGTSADPYLVEWVPDDPRNPMRMAFAKKWLMAIIMAFATLAVSFASTAFSGALPQVETDLHVSSEQSTLAVSLFVLGFALGPMLWAPLSELYGRQILYFVTMGLVTVFGAGSCAAPNIATLLVLRFLAGATGASAIVNSAGVIADIFAPRERGLAVTVYSSAPFLGPTLGPVCGGFLAASAGWKWTDGLTVAFTGVMWVAGALIVPETYSPVLLQHRANDLSRQTGKVYKSKIEVDKGSKTAAEIFSVTLKRPWIILAVEPIALLLAVYSAIVYGTLYLIFSAFPIVFRSQRGWSQGVSSLSFLGVMVGQILAMFYSVILDKRYKAYLASHGGVAPPEQRLWPCLIGSVMMPVGLFWFAFTTYPQVHWSVSVIGSSLFGFGQVLVFLSVINYMIDAYTLYAASALASNAILRALFGFAFPLFTTQMYNNLGVQWASSIPAFLALACVPFPFLFYKYGAAIRRRCPYAAESARFTDALQAQGHKKHVEESVNGEKQARDEEAGSGTVSPADTKESA